MENKKFLFLIVFTAGLLLAVLPLTTEAETATSKAVFVDLDGDGFDDNAADEDSDGIPNDADADYDPVSETNNNSGDFIDFGQTIQEIGLSPDLTSNSQSFGKRQFKTRGLTLNRCGFDANGGFGSGNEIGIGVSSGGGCAGGVCGG